MERRGQEKKVLLAGSLKRPITPTIKSRHVFIAGDRTMRQATEIHDELWAQAVAVRYDETTLVLVALDLLGLPQEHVSYVREQAVEMGLPGENLIITCTRNHTGPDTMGQWSKRWLSSGLNLRYIHFLRRELVEIIRLAIQSLQPAQVYLARQQVPDPCGSAESKELAVLQFRTTEDKTIATVVNFSLVPQVLDEHNTAISADFAHWLYLDLNSPGERDQATLYICAEAGEQHPPAFRDRSWAEAERIGRGLAKTVQSALADVPAVEIERLSVWHKPMTLQPDGAAARWLKHLRISGNGTMRAPAGEIGLVELGPARMAVVPGLLAPQIGSQVRRMLDAPYRFVLGISNDGLGYVPPPPASGAPTMQPSLFDTLILDELDQLLLRAQGADSA